MLWSSHEPKQDQAFAAAGLGGDRRLRQLQRAALQLDVTQSTISHAILEDELGLTLVQRVRLFRRPAGGG